MTSLFASSAEFTGLRNPTLEFETKKQKKQKSKKIEKKGFRFTKEVKKKIVKMIIKGLKRG